MKLNKIACFERRVKLIFLRIHLLELTISQKKANTYVISLGSWGQKKKSDRELDKSKTPNVLYIYQRKRQPDPNCVYLFRDFQNQSVSTSVEFITVIGNSGRWVDIFNSNKLSQHLNHKTATQNHPKPRTTVAPLPKPQYPDQLFPKTPNQTVTSLPKPQSLRSINFHFLTTTWEYISLYTAWTRGPISILITLVKPVDEGLSNEYLKSI